ncbi:MAG: hypothetical protein ACKOOL_11305 [Novosphingobium sp.]
MMVPVLAQIWLVAVSCYLIWRVVGNAESKVATFKILPITGNRYQVRQIDHPVWYWLVLTAKLTFAVAMIASIVALDFGWAQ